jgi:hypothetical protein
MCSVVSFFQHKTQLMAEEDLTDGKNALKVAECYAFAVDEPCHFSDTAIFN